MDINNLRLKYDVLCKFGDLTLIKNLKYSIEKSEIFLKVRKLYIQ